MLCIIQQSEPCAWMIQLQHMLTTWQMSYSSLQHYETDKCCVHYLCTWYSEGLRRRRSEGAPGWRSGEDRGYTPQARWYLQYRTERTVCKTSFTPGVKISERAMLKINSVEHLHNLWLLLFLQETTYMVTTYILLGPFKTGEEVRTWQKKITLYELQILILKLEKLSGNCLRKQELNSTLTHYLTTDEVRLVTNVSHPCSLKYCVIRLKPPDQLLN